MISQNADPADSEDVFTALRTRATRVPMNANHTAFSNPAAEDTVPPVSY